METVDGGSGNTAIGPEALKLANGSNNVGLGEFSLSNLGSSSDNTAIGSQSGTNLTTGKENVFLGYSAGYTQISGDGNISIGASVVLANLSASNQMNIGNTIYATGMKTASVKVGIGNGNNTPSSTLDVNGSISKPIRVETGNYTATDGDYTIIFNHTSGKQTLSLPAASTCKGRIYHIRNMAITNTADRLVIDPDGTEKIDGSETMEVGKEGLNITSTSHSVTIQSDGSGWWIISATIE